MQMPLKQVTRRAMLEGGIAMPPSRATRTSRRRDAFLTGPQLRHMFLAQSIQSVCEFQTGIARGKVGTRLVVAASIPAKRMMIAGLAALACARPTSVTQVILGLILGQQNVFRLSVVLTMTASTVDVEFHQYPDRGPAGY